MTDTHLVVAVGTLAMLFLVAGIIIFILIYQRKIIGKNNEIRNIEMTMASSEKDMLYAVLEGQDVERKRIAEELHDGVCSLLSTMKMYVDAMQMPNVTIADDHVDTLSEIAKNAYSETHRIAMDINQRSYEDFDLMDKLLRLRDTVNGIGKLQIAIKAPSYLAISPGAEIELYRILQELINNSLKHSGGSNIQIDLSSDKESLTVVFEDDGRGFKVEKVAQGIGTTSISHRLGKLKAQWTVVSEPDSGVNYTIRIPTHEPDQDTSSR